MTLNYTIPVVAFYRDNASMFNSGCLPDITKFKVICENYRLQVWSQLSQHFMISFIAMAVLMIYQGVVHAQKFPYSQTEFYQFYIDGRIDMIMYCLLIFNIVFLFVM